MKMQATILTVLLAVFAFVASGCFQVNTPDEVNVNVGGKKENVKYSTDKEYWKNYGKSYTSSDGSDSSAKKSDDDEKDDD